jgi:hypothetical protein
LRLSAAATSRSVASVVSPAMPVRSIALTSMCPASHGAIVAAEPVRMLTTPPGTSEVASTSENVTAGSGRSYDDTTTAVLPVTTTGATTLTRPSSEDSCGASTATTPVGSGVDRLKNGPATGLALPTTWVILSAQPAYQTRRSTASSTTFSALAADRPSDCTTACTNCGRRSSITSAIRYRIWARLYAVRPAQPGNALRAAVTASLASLRDARAALATNFPLLSVTS